MQRRPPAAIPPLALVIPHPRLPRRRSSLLSQVSDPHTPPNCNSPLPLLASSSNRKSSDSWNSSNYDGADDLEFEWTPEQMRLLSRTLDALPAHLLTPFNGAVPPSNLLDKIARGVTNAKGPLDWQHSLRATRAKIVELARIRAKEAANETASDTIAEEDGPDPDVLQQTTNTGPKRPLYRQSSMDFMQISKHDLKDNGNINRLSRRLQRADRMISNPSYHPYARPSSRSSSPPLGLTSRGLVFPSTPSSTTLNSSVSSSRIPRLRRSMSSMSNSSDSYICPAIDPRVQRVKRSDSFGGSVLYGPGQSLKRAPSFGVASKRSSEAMRLSLSSRDSDVTSSDEEEKLRSVKAKKARMKAQSPTPPPASSPVVSPEKPKSPKKPGSQPTNKAPRTNKDNPPRRSTKAKANIQRNPSILGGELPHLQPNLQSPAANLIRPSPRTDISKSRKFSKPTDPVKSHIPTPATLTPTPPATPQNSQNKPLRRSKGTRLPQRPIARKISFGNIPAPEDEDSTGPASGFGLGLGSAFQLQ
ncbi:hypothetical protein AcV5_008442 [Taiwanofungus camphoratus]|nr:hypothetical protein AcV5_008442 [Antrodia cinnamomea]